MRIGLFRFVGDSSLRNPPAYQKHTFFPFKENPTGVRILYELGFRDRLDPSLNLKRLK